MIHVDVISIRKIGSFSFDRVDTYVVAIKNIRVGSQFTSYLLLKLLLPISFYLLYFD